MILSAPIRDLEPRPPLEPSEGSSVFEAVRLMRDERIGAVLVTRDGRPVGIFTERDVLRKAVFSGLSPDTPFIVSFLPGRVRNLPPEPHLQAHSQDGG